MENLSLLAENIIFLSETYVLVHVFFQFPSLVADIGGMLGLFLGLSIVGVFEIVELIFDLCRVGWITS